MVGRLAGGVRRSSIFIVLAVPKRKIGLYTGPLDAASCPLYRSTVILRSVSARVALNGHVRRAAPDVASALLAHKSDARRRTAPH